MCVVHSIYEIFQRDPCKMSSRVWAPILPAPLSQPLVPSEQQLHALFPWHSTQPRKPTGPLPLAHQPTTLLPTPAHPFPTLRAHEGTTGPASTIPVCPCSPHTEQPRPHCVCTGLTPASQAGPLPGGLCDPWAVLLDEEMASGSVAKEESPP